MGGADFRGEDFAHLARQHVRGVKLTNCDVRLHHRVAIDAGAPAIAVEAAAA
jgi:hypothetical protein